MVDTISAATARRIALAAQGFGRSTVAPGARALNQVIHRLGVLQLDSVNVFERSHYLPAFSRLGAYDKTILDRLTFGPRSAYTEAWAHQAALIPIESWPLWRWAMAARRAPDSEWSQWAAAHPAMLDFLRAELAAKGPLPASRIEHDANRRNGPWWGWSEVKTGLECLFMWGEVVTAGRTRFERHYDLVERGLPFEIYGRDIAKADAVRELVSIGARALGIGTQRDIADYFRLPQTITRTAITELAESGELLPVAVHGWGTGAWLHRDARLPRRIETAALLSPFDPVVWQRERVERMFGFHYRIEIYTPAPKRVFGYYSLPVLIDEAIVGRIDLKTDRQNAVLRVQSAWREARAPAGIEARIAPLLRETADWQGMERIEITGRGDLADALADALEQRPVL